VMEEGVERLTRAMSTMNDDDKRLADLYLVRIGQIQALFRFAQLIITSILDKAGQLDLEDVSHISIE